MQTQPRSIEPRPDRVQRARQALHIDDDAFKGGEAEPRPRLGLRPPWMTGTSRLFKAPESGADGK